MARKDCGQTRLERVLFYLIRQERYSFLILRMFSQAGARFEQALVALTPGSRAKFAVACPEFIVAAGW